MSLCPQVERCCSERLNIRLKSRRRRIGDYLASQGLLKDPFAQIAQRLMINAPIDKTVLAAGSPSDPHEMVGSGRQGSMKNSIVSAGNCTSKVDLSRSAGRGRRRQSS